MPYMPRLEGGRRASVRDFGGKDWIADLIYAEGPLLALFKGDRGNDTLILWLDCDRTRNRWVAFDVDRIDLRDYLNQRVSLKQLICKNEELMVFHTNDSSRRSSVKRLKLAEFPQDYMPSDESYWEPSFGTLDANNLIIEAAEEYKLGLDGESWFLDDFSRVTRTYRQLYAFNYAIFQRARSAVRSTVAEKLSTLAWRGGFSTVQWFDALGAVTPSVHRVRVREIRYASPGYIAIDALPSVSRKVADSISRLSSVDDRERVEKHYGDAYKFFSRYGLTKLDLTVKAHRERLKVAEVESGVSYFLDYFLKFYGFSKEKEDLLSAGAVELSLLKAILSYHRRAVQLASYVDEGSLEIP